VDKVEGGTEDAELELRFIVDKAKAAAKGLTVAQVFTEVQKALTEESKATSVTWDSKQYDVMLIENKTEDLTPDHIKKLKFSVTARDGS
jgi:multidrug efflux pump subunit AcrB